MNGDTIYVQTCSDDLWMPVSLVFAINTVLEIGQYVSLFHDTFTW